MVPQTQPSKRNENPHVDAAKSVGAVVRSKQANVLDGNAVPFAWDQLLLPLLMCANKKERVFMGSVYNRAGG